MAHMRPEITVKQRGWRVETRDAGTCYVPSDVVDVPEVIRNNRPLQRADDPDLFELLVKRLRDYVPGFDCEEIEAVEGYFGRYSAPGYLDAEEWNFDKTLRGIREALRQED